MARRMPSSSSSPMHPLVHHAITLTFLAAWIAAAFAIITSLCSSCHRKPSSRTPPSPHPPPNNESVSKQEREKDTTPAPTGQILEHHGRAEEEVTTVIDVATHGPIPPTALPVSSSSSRRKLSISLSTRLPEKMRTSRREQKEKERGTTSEETLWKKTIILGEKCRVPSDEEEEDDEGTKNYRPRTPRSRDVSRTNSFAYSDGVQS